MNWILLCLSVILSTGRNLLSKKISSERFGTPPFFRLQACIFGAGAAVLLLPAITEETSVAPLTFGYALLCGLLLVGAQWCYTAALNRGNTAVCATVYALGFLLPTLSGMVFWSESVTPGKILGILAVFPALILSGKKRTPGKECGQGYLIPLLSAMLCSGGLGILQKIQQSSPYPEQRTAFVCGAFAAAAILSLFFGIRKKAQKKITASSGTAAIGIGACFAVCNLLNTLLAGRMDSAVFFPCLNIGTILLSTALSIFLFKEKLTKKHLWILGLGFSAILLINLPL